MFRKIIIPVFLVLLTALAIYAQEQPSQKEKTQQGMMGMQQDMMSKCKDMMAKKDEMMKKMDDMDKKLDDLVQQMNTAKGNNKVDATAAVINELVAQRKAMRATMQETQPMMVRHMMQHMGMGMMKSMMDCPMMKAPEKKEGEERP